MMKPGTLLRVLISIAALVLIPFFLRDKLNEAFFILRDEINYGWFAVAAVIFYVSMAMTAVRMHGILRFKNFALSFGSTLYVTFLGLFFSMFLPSAIGGDIIKAVYLSRFTKAKADVFSCIVMDRFSGFCVVVSFALLSSALLRESWNPVPAWAGWTAFAVFITAGAGALISPEIIPLIFSKLRFLPARFQEKLNSFYDSLSGFFHNRPVMLRNLGYSLLAQSLFIVAYFFIGKSLEAPIPFTRFFMMVPMITIISMPPSINGLGVREAGALFLFKMYMPDERALAMTVLISLLTYASSAAGGIWYLIRGVWGNDGLRGPAKQDS